MANIPRASMPGWEAYYRAAGGGQPTFAGSFLQSATKTGGDFFKWMMEKRKEDERIAKEQAIRGGEFKKSKELEERKQTESERENLAREAETSRHNKAMEADAREGRAAQVKYYNTLERAQTNAQREKARKELTESYENRGRIMANRLLANSRTPEEYAANFERMMQDAPDEIKPYIIPDKKFMQQQGETEKKEDTYVRQLKAAVSAWEASGAQPLEDQRGYQNYLQAKELLKQRGVDVRQDIDTVKKKLYEHLVNVRKTPPEEAQKIITTATEEQLYNALARFGIQ